jgi:hypothetical protein
MPLGRSITKSNKEMKGIHHDSELERFLAINVASH